MEDTIRQFATYEISLLLKELGFNEKCLACYSPHMGNGIFELIKEGTSNERSCFNSRFINSGAVNGCSSPLWQQVIDWLIKKYNIYIWIQPINSFIDDEEELESLIFLFKHKVTDNPLEFESNEQAILKAIEIIKTRLL